MTTDFLQNHHAIIRNAVDRKIIDFVYEYFLLKRKVATTIFENKYSLDPDDGSTIHFRSEWGTWEDPQVKNTYSHYSDIVMEVLLSRCLDIMERTTGLELYPTYSYARIYKKNDVLYRHKDRFSCEISTTMNLGGDEWPIFIETERNVGLESKEFPAATSNPGRSVILQPGDMLVYKGNLCEHWRERFNGTTCAQVFLHYNNKKTTSSEKNKFDGRLHLGLPAIFRTYEHSQK